MSAAPRILLARNVFSNVGDEAMLECEIGGLRATFPSCSLVVLTDDPATVRSRYRVNAQLSEVSLTHPFGERGAALARTGVVRRTESHFGGRLVTLLLRPLAELYLRLSCASFVWGASRIAAGRKPWGLTRGNAGLLRVLATSDLIIGGGGLIPSIGRIYRPKVAFYRAAALLTVPLVLHGQTILGDPARRTPYHTAACVILRDRTSSRKTAQRMGVNERQLVDGVDPAFALPSADAAAVDEALAGLGRVTTHEGLRGGGFPRVGFVALNVRRGDRRNHRRAIDAMADALEGYRARYPDMSLLLFGMQSHRAEDDAIAIRELLGRLPSGARVVVLDTAIAPSLLKGILARASVVITCRYHGAVFAFTQGVPTIGLSTSPEYQVKLAGIFEMYGADRFLLGNDTLEASHLVRLLEIVRTEREELVAEIRERDAVLRPLLAVPYETCEGLLNTRSGHTSAYAEGCRSVRIERGTRARVS